MGKKGSRGGTEAYQQPTPHHTPPVEAYGEVACTPPVYTPQQSAAESSKVAQVPISDGERYTRLAVGVTHGIASAILGGFGGEGGRQGAESIGELQQMALNAGFGR